MRFPSSTAALTAARVMLVAVVSLAAAGPAMAAGCPQPDAGQRLEWIDSHLSRAGDAGRLWTWGWGGGIAASGVASLAVVPFVSAGDRVDWYTSAGSAAIGMIPFLFSPLLVTRDSRELHARRLDGERAGVKDICPLLSDAEALLVRDAQDQEQRRRWWYHAGNVAFNTGVTLFLGFGFHHWGGGLINGIAGAAVGEAIIFTQPTRTIDDLRHYREGLAGSVSSPVAWGYRGSF